MGARMVAVVLVLAGTLFSPAFADGSTPGDDPSTEPPTEPTTSPTTEPPLPQIVVRERPRVSGTVRFGRQVTRTVGKYSVSSLTLNTVWLRDGKAIPGARSAKYKIQVRDVGHQISVRVTARRAGFLPVTSESKKRTAKHVRDVRRTVKYTVVTRGAITTNVQTFRRQVDETLNDPRGWRAAGIKFTQVKSGGSMNVKRLFTQLELPRWKKRDYQSRTLETRLGCVERREGLRFAWLPPYGRESRDWALAWMAPQILWR